MTESYEMKASLARAEQKALKRRAEGLHQMALGWKERALEAEEESKDWRYRAFVAEEKLEKVLNILKEEQK